MDTDTICAISTSLGVGAISIIRLSGPESIKIANKIFEGKNLEKVDSHTINYGFIKDKDEYIDEVLVSIMKSPKTFTMEDIVEINCHGGLATTNKVLELLLTNGCRLAEPGEFTKRAFLNGRIDLLEAEAIGDLINSESESSRKMAMNQVKGKLSKLIDECLDNFLDIQANIAVNIDYPEYEDEVVMTHEMLKNKLTANLQKLENLLDESKNGKIIKNGINIAIVGRPNVGKSSILNALLDENKAIVTNIAGTTRDIVEGTITLQGIKLNLTDTAGIRETSDIVERIGVDKSLEKLEDADLVILVFNNNEKLTKEDKELIEKTNNKQRIIFVNKNDLDKKIELNEDYIEGNTQISEGLDKLKKEIIDMFNLEKLNKKDFTYLSNARQISLVQNSINIIKDILNNINNEIPVDMLEIDIQRAYETLAELVGKTYQDEFLDKLFSKYCLGK